MFNERKLAILDVDGTLFNGTLGIEFLKDLLQQGLFSADLGEQIMHWFKKYKNGEAPKHLVVDEIYRLFVLGMTGALESDIHDVAGQTWLRVKSNIFATTGPLLSTLKKNNYLILFISGSSIEIVTHLANEYDISLDNVIAGRLEIDSKGIYTGNVISYPGSAEQKVELLDSFISAHDINVDWKKSFCMGDNERDALVLNRCGYSVAFNPNEALYKLAREKSWIIADEKSLLSQLNYIFS